MKQLLNGFLQQVGEMIYRYLRKRGLTHEDAEDIVQDTCYKYLIYMDGIKSDIAPRWMYRVAINQFYDLKRKEKRYADINIEDLPLITLTHLPELSVLEKEQATNIKKSMLKLSEIHQELLILKYEMELSYKEISALLDMNENTLKTHIKRAKEQFIKHYKEVV